MFNMYIQAPSGQTTDIHRRSIIQLNGNTFEFERLMIIDGGSINIDGRTINLNERQRIRRRGRGRGHGARTRRRNRVQQMEEAARRLAAAEEQTNAVLAPSQAHDAKPPLDTLREPAAATAALPQPPQVTDTPTGSEAAIKTEKDIKVEDEA